MLLAAQASVLKAYADQQALLDRVRALEEENANMKAWDSSKSAYQLKAIGTGAFAYVPKPSVSSEEPPHWLCVKCYENRKKPVLQSKGRTKDNRSNIWSCPMCSGEIIVSWSVNPQSFAERIGEISNE